MQQRRAVHERREPVAPPAADVVEAGGDGVHASDVGSSGSGNAMEAPVGVVQEGDGNSTFDSDLLEMEHFVCQIPAADGSDVAAAPKLPTTRSRKRKQTPAQRAAKKGSQEADGDRAQEATRLAPTLPTRTATPGIVKSTRGKRTSAEVWAQLSDKEKARRESNRRSAQLAKQKKAEEIKKLEESNAAKRAKIAELDRLLPALTEEARRAAAEMPEHILDPDAQAAVAAAVAADPVLEELFG